MQVTILTSISHLTEPIDISPTIKIIDAHEILASGIFDEEFKFQYGDIFQYDVLNHHAWAIREVELEEGEDVINNVGNSSARFPFPILRNYLEYTFRKLVADDSIAYTDDRKFCCFNTGLVTPNLEDIYAYFEENRSNIKTLAYKSPYFFRAFIKESDREFLSLFSDRIPESANYFTSPEDLIFNPKLKLIIDIDHIIQDSRHRFPEHIKNAPDMIVRSALIGSVDYITKRIKSNYRLAIPEWYDGKIHLLLPLYLADHKRPDLALVAQKVNPKTYSAQACLTIGMAYNNARLITRPYSGWLEP